jgi:hypothetical protein
MERPDLVGLSPSVNGFATILPHWLGSSGGGVKMENARRLGCHGIPCVCRSTRGGIRFRDIEIFNLAFLARRVWRILTEPESLSARILKVVYFPGSDILSATMGTRPSQIWHSFCEGETCLRLG